MGARDLVTAVRCDLARHADPERAAKQQAYMKSAMPYRGLTSPELRAAMRPILADPAYRPASRDEWEAAIRELWDGATHREERYAAIAIARHRFAKPFRAQGAVGLWRYLIATGAWWDLVDEIATHLVRDELLADPPRVGAEMRRWAVDPDMWIRRAAILCQVGARERIDADLLRDVILPNLEGTQLAGPSGRQDFFIRKGIGWALRDYAKTAPDWVRNFVADHGDQLAGLTVREALRRL